MANNKNNTTKHKKVTAVQKNGPKPAKRSRAARRRAAKERWELAIGGVGVAGIGSWEGMSLKTGRGARREARSMVGLGERAVNIQAEMPRIIATRGANDVLRGTEYIDQVSTSADGEQTGNILAAIMINPSIFRNTRLAQFSNLYQRYKFTKARIFYQADANATQSGSIVGFMDYDPDNLLLFDDPLNVKKAAAHYAEQPTKIWQSRDFFLGQVDKYTDLYINTSSGQEDRLIYQGVFYLIAATELPASTALGTIYLDYEIEFSIPALENIPEDFLVVAQVRGSEPGTAAQPFETSPLLSERWNTDFPEPNLTPVYNAGSSSFTFPDLRRGVYLLYSRWDGEIVTGSGVNSLSWTWSCVDSPSATSFTWNSGVFLDPSISYTVYAQSAGTGVTASLFRNVFVHTFTVFEDGDYELHCEIDDIATGVSYSGEYASFVLSRQAALSGNGVGMGKVSSRLNVKSLRKDGCLVKRTRSVGKITKNEIIPKTEPEKGKDPLTVHSGPKGCSCCGSGLTRGQHKGNE